MKPQRGGVPRGRTAGFALIEALIAFAILSIALGALLSGIAAGLRADRHVAARRLALRSAQTRLARLGVADPLAPGRRDGVTGQGQGQGQVWRQSVTPVGVRAGKGAAAPPSPVAAYWAEVTITLEDGGDVSLRALKLAPLERRPRT